MEILTRPYFGELDFRIKNNMEYIWEKEINGVDIFGMEMALKIW